MCALPDERLWTDYRLTHTCPAHDELSVGEGIISSESRMRETRTDPLPVTRLPSTLPVLTLRGLLPAHRGPAEHPVGRAAQQRALAPLRIDAQLELRPLPAEGRRCGVEMTHHAALAWSKVSRDRRPAPAGATIPDVRKGLRIGERRCRPQGYRPHPSASNTPTGRLPSTSHGSTIARS